MTTSNPALSSGVFQIESTADHAMTLQGTVWKTGALLAVTLTGAGVTWWQVAASPALARPLMIGGFLIGAVIALITIFKPTVSAFTAPLYAAAEGVALGAISQVIEVNGMPGIAVQAVGLTFGTLAMMLLAYQSGLVRATEKFKLGVIAATGGIALLYFATIVLGFFGIQVPMIYSNGPIGIAFSVFVVVIAALNLVLDFDSIDRGVEQGAPKYMEWYGAFALLVTLVWLYLEILRLLSKLRGRD
ncbi:MAG: Bax inhibitor-1/YccA family protein [Pirellulales bacterium]